MTSHQCGAAAIGDNGQDQRLIRTVARKGFRFVGGVRSVEESESLRPLKAGPAKPTDVSASSLELPDALDYGPAVPELER